MNISQRSSPTLGGSSSRRRETPFASFACRGLTQALNAWTLCSVVLLAAFLGTYLVFSSSLPVQGSSLLRVKDDKPSGVFLIKTLNTQHVGKTLCTLHQFLNHKHKYPIRIFVQEEDDEDISAYAEGVDLKIVVEKRWKDFPSRFTEEQRAAALEQCTNFDDKKNARCTSLKVPLGYVHNTYWSYMEMQDEPELQEFEYFVLLDDDSFLTKPMPDPFQIMKENDLVGIYNLQSFEGGLLTTGVQEAANAVFSVEERQGRYLDNPKLRFFNDEGIWTGPRHKPGVWMCFYGGRLDFLRSKRYREFASLVAPHTYVHRTSRQSVIPVAWAILAGDRVWYLPHHNIEMGVYHHGWVDDSEIIRSEGNATTPYMKHTLETWAGYEETSINKLLSWKEYVETEHHGANDDDLQKCIKAPGRGYGSS